jgi:hypothetical protein
MASIYRHSKRAIISVSHATTDPCAWSSVLRLTANDGPVLKASTRVLHGPAVHIAVLQHASFPV